MMHEQFKAMDSIPEIRRLHGQKNAKDWIQLCDWPGFVKLCRSSDYLKETAKMLEAGDELTANAVEASMAALENDLLITTGMTVRDDVTGACPNVPAYIQGSPYNMRNKRRDKTGRGPLSLFIEMTGSGGLNSEDMIERGAALYALVRALSIARPLELWVTMTYGGHAGIMAQTAVRVETNPLDLNRAVCILTKYDEIARAGYWLDKVMCPDSSGGWAYGVPELERKYAGEILGRIISPGSQIAYMPAGLLGVDDFGDPNDWIRNMLRQYSPYLLSGDDREDVEETL